MGDHSEIRETVSDKNFRGSGIVYLVGAGPGDERLITVKGMDLIGTADVVVYDHLAAPSLLERARPDAEVIYVGKRGALHAVEQQEINNLLVAKAREGKTVVRLKGGDPFVFGRGGEEAEELVEAGVTFEVVPGVTSAVGAPAYAGIPVTHRDHASQVTFITGHENPDKPESAIDWENLARNPGTLVFLMGVKNLPNISASLVAHGKSPDTPAALVRWGTTARQVCVSSTLEDIPAEAKRRGIKPPAVLIVGSVVSLRDTLNWFERKPLFGKRIVITRSRSQSRGMADAVSAMGGDPILFPTIATVPPNDMGPLDDTIEQIGDFDWVIFTSVNGVEFFFRRFFHMDKDIRDMAGPKIGAIGPVTARRLRDHGLKVNMIAAEFKAEGVLAGLAKEDVQGKRFLIPRAERARETLPQGIAKMGGDVHVVTAYRTIRPDDSDVDAVRKVLKELSVAAVTFTSSSTVRHFVEMVGDGVQELLDGVVIASIGPVTSSTMRELGLHVTLEASRYTIDGLMDALVNHFGGHCA